MTKEQYLNFISDWTNFVTPTGIKYGYPHCCIHAFAHQPPQILKHQRTDKTDIIRFRASKINGEYSGFIPCYFHAQQILKGHIKLQDLIKNRDKSLSPFPNDWTLK